MDFYLISLVSSDGSIIILLGDSCFAHPHFLFTFRAIVAIWFSLYLLSTDVFSYSDVKIDVF